MGLLDDIEAVSAAILPEAARAAFEAIVLRAHRYEWLLPILTGEDGCEDRLCKLGEALSSGLEGEAAINAAMEA